MGQTKQCPFCKSNNLTKIDRKYLVTSLLSCEVCGLNHRHPKDDAQWMKKFYQKTYQIDNGWMTSLPTDEEIEAAKADNFAKRRNYAIYIDALFGGNRNLKVLDYGCSWGYNVYKLKGSGYDAQGFEVSAPRAKFGEEKLGVKIYTDEADLVGFYDVVMSSHVIEHLADIPNFLALARNILKPGGIFMAFCPNGSAEFAQRNPHMWKVNWGNVHPNHLSTKFVEYAFSDNPHLILTGDWTFDPDDLRTWDGTTQKTTEAKDGKELLIIAKSNKKA